MKSEFIKFFAILALLTTLFGAAPASPVGAEAQVLSSIGWNTFLGDSGYDEGWSVTVDGDGNVYVAGNSDAAWGDNPIRAYTGGFDVFVAKLDSSGVLQWHTFLGGSGEEIAASIAVDADGFVYITGQSDATWDGVTPIRAHTSGIDAFAAKLWPNGSLNWYTFLGGNAGDYGRSIALGGDGFVYVTGVGGTWGTPVQAHNGNNDAFVAKLWGTGILEWNTFFGSNTYDAGASIAVDADGNIYVSGTSANTWGAPVRAHSSGYEAFAAKLNSAGALQWNTFLGGIGSDYGNAIALDGSQALYMAGESDATWGSPLRAYSSDQDAFAAKLNPATGALQWNTFFGGGELDQGRGIAVGGGNVYIAGLSGSSWGSPIRGYSGGFDAFVVKLNPSGALQWNSFIGGSNYDLGASIVVNGSGNIYMTGQSHAAWGAPVEAYTSDGDAFVVMLPSPDVTATFRSSAAQDGWVLESSETSNKGGTINKGGKVIHIGDDASNRQYRAILSFNTSSIPADAVILKVTLRVRRQGVTGGGNPVNIFKGFVVDVKKGNYGTAALQLADFQTKGNKSISGLKPALVSSWYDMNLTGAKAQINPNGNTQIRLRFKLDDNNNSVANFLKIHSGNAAAASRPQLIVEYYAP